MWPCFLHNQDRTCSRRTAVQSHNSSGNLSLLLQNDKKHPRTNFYLCKSSDVQQSASSCRVAESFCRTVLQIHTLVKFSKILPRNWLHYRHVCWQWKPVLPTTSERWTKHINFSEDVTCHQASEFQLVTHYTKSTEYAMKNVSAMLLTRR
jgi:hypothetical protein